MAQLTDDCFAFGGPLLSIEEAAELIGGRIAPLTETEPVPVMAADGRWLAQDVHAPINLPPFANSAVDGYAVAHALLDGSGPTRMRVMGRVAAGQAHAPVAAAGAIQVFTGAPMPPGTDTVFMQEDVTREGDHVSLPPGLKRGANSRPAGEDIASGDIAVRAGERLKPQHLALAAALGLTSLTLRRRVRVGVISTGDELTEAGRPLGEAAIYDSNRVLLLTLAARAGAEVIDLGIARDRRDPLADRLKDAAQRCDLILTSGGVSTGEEDHVKDAVEQVGQLAFWRIAIKPGRPVAMGVIDGAAFVGLPGNPAAVFVTFAFVVVPLLARLAGGRWQPPRRVPVRVDFSYRKKAGRREFVRVSLQRDPAGGFVATKFPRDGAGMITSLTETDGLLELADDLTGLQPGDVAPFLAYGDLT
jgi:molybdopterin molybdotransferase